MLVARSYLVFHYNRFGDQTTVEHFDIGRGAAYGSQNNLEANSRLAAVFLPLCWVELQVRGYGEYPMTWPEPEVGFSEEIDRIKKELKKEPVPDIRVGVVSEETYKRWRTLQSYYALVEIIDAHFASRSDYNRATKKDVFKHLGKPNWGTIKEDPKKYWAYQGFGRHVPYGDKIIFAFNDKDELIDIGWVSE